MSEGQFQGKAVIVTGGGTGIGQVTAREFARRGANVLVVGRTAERLAETAEGSPRIRLFAADLTEAGAAEAIVVAALAEFGRIDVLVNNAGIVGPAALGEIKAGAFDEVVATNLLAPVYLVQAAMPHLSETEGAVVNVTTAIGQRGWPMPGREFYAATKAALESLTRSWAVQLAPRGIRVTAVAPGPVATEIYAREGLSAEQGKAQHEGLREMVPLRRLAQPEEVAHWIVEVASPDAEYITGVVMPVDGGAVIA
ncbi:NAD(P)-dependent dehydrogenase (short-subunit alcohol dehydrogenase family) [Amycolatopsis echigonensis]|uniref:NAD(P)-dependent dehydrogenase (Short-subunit alcohol dehydrogenase family) n=1 Tax=Amycolatopsis echigonensis TaxID=2576905 RepID=A0A2N3WM21_9PSEU|nr:SDR family oxidoreductase [Amycolatopsis niigatensis]PKV94903.1 NAD(P)-dependent dehydrogenase (short-subunit alcohol dehydrogenase family) [Amycolatopsis niigatensis]